MSVSVALHKAHHRCRFLKRNGRLTKPRPCKPARWLKATGKRMWRLRARRRLPKGRYTIRTRAVDRAGNREKLKRPRFNFRRIRMR